MARVQSSRGVIEVTGNVVANGATFTGTVIDLANSNNPLANFFSEVRCGVFSDQAGNLIWETSYDKTTWRVVSTTAVLANTYVIAKTSALRRYMRPKFTSTAGSSTTVFEMESVAVAIP